MEVPSHKRQRRDSFAVVLAGLDPETKNPATQVNSYLDSFPSINSILDTQYDHSNVQLGMGLPGLDGQFELEQAAGDRPGVEPPTPAAGASDTLDLADEHGLTGLFDAPAAAQDLGGSLGGGNETLAAVNYVPTPVTAEPPNFVDPVPAATDWKTAFEPQRVFFVQKIELVLQEYTPDTKPFAKEIEQAAFDNSKDREEYDKLLAIQCYKLRKLARGEFEAPPPPPTIDVTDAEEPGALPNLCGNDPRALGGLGDAVTGAGGLLGPPQRRDSRLPSLPFLGDLTAVDLLTWQPSDLT